jgi:serine protease Do
MPRRVLPDRRALPDRQILPDPQALPDRRSRPRMLIALSLALILLGATCKVVLGAQAAVEAGPGRLEPVSPDKRAELYRQLRSQAKILEAQSAVVKTVVKLIGPAVVHIEAETTSRAALQHGGGRHVEEAGSGVIIQWKDQHFVLTNRHVISGASPEEIDISLADGRWIHPQKVWEDPDTDVAVMAISEADLVAAPIGDSDAVEIGDFVLAVGSPFGLSHSVTYGIISAKGRRGLNLGSGKTGVRLQDFLQTDAAINPGNSGGPLINLRGEVIAINTAIASNSGGSEGIGFAIPINMFMSVARQLIERGKVSRAFLGVTLDRQFTAEKAAEAGLSRLVGALVIAVTPGSPAEKAKLKKGDVILQVGESPVQDDNHLVNLISRMEIGKEISLVIFRDGQQVRVRVAVADLEGFRPAR